MIEPFSRLAASIVLLIPFFFAALVTLLAKALSSFVAFKEGFAGESDFVFILFIMTILLDV
jgi:hypothetical protein